jgi:hypothetical protein
MMPRSQSLVLLLQEEAPVAGEVEEEDVVVVEEEVALVGGLAVVDLVVEGDRHSTKEGRCKKKPWMNRQIKEKI